MRSRKNYLHGYSEREKLRLIRQAEVHKDLLLSNLILNPGEKLLEIGCGVGAALEKIAFKAPMALLSGIDINSVQVKSAHQYLAEQGVHGVDLVVGDGSALPWPADHFDRVRLIWLIEHLDDPASVLHEAFRVLYPGGTIHITETDYSSLRVSPYDPAIQALLSAFQDHFNRHGNAHAGPSLGPLLEQAGFQQVTVDMVGIHHWCEAHKEKVKDFINYLLEFISPELSELESAATSNKEARLIRYGHHKFEQLSQKPDAAISLSIYQAMACKP